MPDTESADERALILASATAMLLMFDLEDRKIVVADDQLRSLTPDSAIPWISAVEIRMRDLLRALRPRSSSQSRLNLNTAPTPRYKTNSTATPQMAIPQASSRGPTCFKCGQRGHIARNCQNAPAVRGSQNDSDRTAALASDARRRERHGAPPFSMSLRDPDQITSKFRKGPSNDTPPP